MTQECVGIIDPMERYDDDQERCAVHLVYPQPLTEEERKAEADELDRVACEKPYSSTMCFGDCLPIIAGAFGSKRCPRCKFPLAGHPG